MRPARWQYALATLAVLLSSTASAQSLARRLTIDTIYDPAERLDFNGAPSTTLQWIDDSRYLEPRRSGLGVEWFTVDATTGDAARLFDPSRLEEALVAIQAVARPSAATYARSNTITFNQARTGALLTIDTDLYFYDFASNAVTRLTTVAGEEEEASFSPDGRWVAFVRGNDLYVADVGGREEYALTSDGSAQMLNGKLDWLYQEEIYGRGRFRGYWWSPDSTRLAFLQLDESKVPEYTIVDDIPYRPDIEVTDYPKAGDTNPGVRLGIARVVGGERTWVDTASYVETDILIVDVAWAPNGSRLTYQVQDREQTWLDLDEADVATGRSRRVLRETTKAWVNVNGSPVWLPDDSFLWFSERSGFKHLYHYRADGTLLRAVTTGRWDVRSLRGVDQARGLVYFEAGVRRHIDTDIYRVGLGGEGLTRVSRNDGTHRANFNPSFTYYIDVWSDVTTPTQVRLHQADGSQLRVIDANPVTSLTAYPLSTPEFLEVPARDGFLLDAMLIRPPDFDPARRYPVYQLTYAGPGTPLVRNRWGGTQYLYHQLLAQQGILVWVLDNRSASGKGAESQWPVYGNLGALELRDLEDGIAWLSRQSYVDSSRIALHGWSYGGFMTAYALTHSTRWSAGIVGAPVTDWRNYDTVYTERYMRTPRNNPEGYRQSAPRFAAANLHGRLLLIHGGIDDNVHRQNTEQFAYELQRAGQPFQMMIYPRQRHGFSDGRLIKHLQQAMFDFITMTLGQPAPTLPSNTP
jgi:dipeptidyl-peptidase-4